MPLDTVKLKALRAREKLTLQEAAERAGWMGVNARQRWADLEAGRSDPRLSTLERVAAALGVGVGELVRPGPAGPKTKR